MREILIFTSAECVPCKQLKAHLDNQSIDKDKIKFADVEQAEGYSVRSVPTILFIDNGIVLDKLVGYQANYVKQIKEYLNGH